MDRIKPLPFTVDRDQPVPLTNQIANGVTRAIHSGYYTAGERLPSLDAIASSLQVGRQTAQNAVRELVSRGEVVARRKAGILVPESKSRVFTHQVAHLRTGGHSYYFAVLHDRLAARLTRMRVQVHAIDLTREEGAAGLPGVHALLNGNAIDLAIIGGHPEVLVDLCRGYGVMPLLMEEAGHFPRAIPGLRHDDSTALRQMAATARDRGVRTVGVLGPESARIRDTLRELGLEPVPFRQSSTAASAYPEATERIGLESMRQLLDTGEPLPDLLYFADDYLARGALTALSWAGLRVPDDLRVVVHTNHGHAPILPIALTRIQTDPTAVADALADRVMDQLQNRGRSVPTVVPFTFVPGETL